MFSNFPFENYLGQLKKLVKKSSDILPQIVRRLSELRNLNTNNSHLTIPDFKSSKMKLTNEILAERCFGPQFEELIFTNYYKLTTK